MKPLLAHVNVLAPCQQPLSESERTIAELAATLEVFAANAPGNEIIPAVRLAREQLPAPEFVS